jgi:hypothetical protein
MVVLFLLHFIFLPSHLSLALLIGLALMLCCLDWNLLFCTEVGTQSRILSFDLHSNYRFSVDSQRHERHLMNSDRTFFHRMIKGYDPRMIRASVEADTSDHKIFLSSGKRLIQKLALGLVPSFVQQQLRLTSIKPQRIHPTSYLDGLRGVASFIVFMGHYTEENVGWFTEPFGLYEDGGK